MVAFLDQVAVDAARDADADGDVAVGAHHVASAREHGRVTRAVRGGPGDARLRDLDHDGTTAQQAGPREPEQQDHGGRSPEHPPPRSARGRRRAPLEPQRRQPAAQFLGALCHQARWSASTTRRWAARQADASPPTRPIAVAKATPRPAPPSGRRRKTVATLKVIMLNCTPDSNVLTASTATAASAAPTRSPPAARRSDSLTKASRMARRPNPRARRVPISAVRLATAAYIVLSAPKVAPVAMTLASVKTST